MSLPARQLQAPRQPSERAARPARTPAARPTPSTPPQRRARRGSHPAFWVFSAVLVAAIVMSIVALNALVVNTTYRLQSVQQRERSLTDEAGTLEIEVAQKSAPSRVAGWARAQGMVLPAPDEVVSIRVPGILEQGRV